MKDFKEKTVSGISWSILTQITSQFCTLATSIVLARLLSPTEYGLIGMVTVITGFATLFMNMGLSSAIIQKKTVSQEELSSVFWFNVLIGVFLTFAFSIGAPLIAYFYNEESLTPLVIFISFNFLIGSLNIVQRTTLSKEIDFKTPFIIQFVSLPVTSVVTIYLAWEGAGVWSLAVQTVLNSIINSTLLWIISPWKPLLIFNWKYIKGLTRFSLNVLGNDALNYWVRNIDNLLIGKFIGIAPLGVYSRSYGILMLPLTNVSQVLGRVLFPSLALIQEDKERVKHVYLKVSRTIALVTFPLMMGLFALSEFFVSVLFGKNWFEMIPIVKIFCFLGLSQSIGTIISNLYLSQGRAGLMFRIGSILRILLIISICFGLNWGIYGVALSYTIASYISSIINHTYAGRLVNLNLIEMLSNLKEIFIASFLMFLVVFILVKLIPEETSDSVVLFSGILLGVLSYFLLCFLFKIKAFKEVIAVVNERLARKQSFFSN